MEVSSSRYCVQIGHAAVCFNETSFGSITPLPYDENLPLNTHFSPELSGLINAYQEDAKKIMGRYPNGLSEITDLDFSNLGLTHLPPHILLECKAARTLDISGNNIHWLPIQLKELSFEQLNISGNKGLQPNLCNFEWLLTMPGLEVIANNMGFNFIPRGWEGRFHSNQIPYGAEWMNCPTQKPPYD